MITVPAAIPDSNTVAKPSRAPSPHRNRRHRRPDHRKAQAGPSGVGHRPQPPCGALPLPHRLRVPDRLSCEEGPPPDGPRIARLVRGRAGWTAVLERSSRGCDGGAEGGCNQGGWPAVISVPPHLHALDPPWPRADAKEIRKTCPDQSNSKQPLSTARCRARGQSPASVTAPPLQLVEATSFIVAQEALELRAVHRMPTPGTRTSPTFRITSACQGRQRWQGQISYGAPSTLSVERSIEPTGAA